MALLFFIKRSIVRIDEICGKSKGLVFAGSAEQVNKYFDVLPNIRLK
jgi:hypothetical protein